MKKIGLSMLVVLCLSACATTQSTQTSKPLPSTELSPTSERIAGFATDTESPPFLITFNGKGCTSDVPETLPLGKHSFLFVNNTDTKLALWIALLPEDITYQNLVDKQPEPGAYFASDDLIDKQHELGWYFLAPYDLRQPAKLADRWSDSLGGKFYTFLFYEEGEYSHALGELNMDALWFCAPFHVIADSSNY